MSTGPGFKGFAGGQYEREGVPSRRGDQAVACPLEGLACPLEGPVPSRRGGLAARSPRRPPLGAATSSPTPVLTCSLPSPPSSPPSPPSSPSSTSTTSPPGGRCTRRPRCCSRHGNSCCCRHRTCCSCCFIVRDPPCCSRELLWSSQHHFTSSSSMCCCHSTREAAVDGATWVRAPGVSSPHPTGDLPLLADRRHHAGAPRTATVASRLPRHICCRVAACAVPCCQLTHTAHT